jgi:hypothetical protein
LGTLLAAVAALVGGKRSEKATAGGNLTLQPAWRARERNILPPIDETGQVFQTGATDAR